MKVFISWSGTRSRRIAEELRTWLPDVINALEPWVSSEDIKPGNRWNPSVTGALDATGVGILCLTPENLSSSWVLFEAGALAKSVSNAEGCVVPLLLCHLPVQSLPGPLEQFQAVAAHDKDAMLKMVKGLNDHLSVSGGTPLNHQRIERAFNRCWHDLEVILTEVSKESPDISDPAKYQSELLDMVYVPRMTHIVGTTGEKLKKLLQEYPGIWEKYFLAEYPAHECSTGDFYIDRYQVTNIQYLRFVLETDYISRVSEFLAHLPEEVRTGKTQIPSNIADHPVVYVSFEDAVAFCDWVQKRLPTEIEWELAARGLDGREYPWGNEWEKGRCNSEEESCNGTMPVGSYEIGKSIYGCYDMAGNVWDWTDSWYDTYPDSKKEYYNENDMGHKNRIIRGGSYAWPSFDQRCAFRALKEPNKALPEIGFRCVRDGQR